MSEKKTKFPYSTILKILVTCGLLLYVVKQIPWKDRVYRISGDAVEIGQALAVEDEMVTFSQGSQHVEVLMNQPFVLEGESHNLQWWFIGKKVEREGDLILAHPLEEIEGVLKGRKRPGASAQQVVLADGSSPTLSIPVSDLAGGIDFGIKPGFPTLLRNLDLGVFFLAFMMISISQVLAAIRWAVLMRARGLVIPWWTCIKLCYMGYFFSQVMPGTSGGDVIRAIYVARDNEDRATAALSVFVDRLVGLFGIAIIGAFAVSLQLDDPHIARYGKMMALIVCFLFIGSCIYFSRKLRKMFFVEKLLSILPLGQKILEVESKLFVYRQHPKAIFWAFMLTGIVQINFILVNYFLARSLGLAEGHLGSFFVFLPIVTVLVSLPVSFGGLGFREALFVKFFTLFGLNGGIGFATSLLQGMVVLVWSLAGGFAFLSLKKDASTQDSEPGVVKCV